MKSRTGIMVDKPASGLPQATQSDVATSLSPTPTELAHLAAQLITAGIISRDAKPFEAMKVAAQWWAEARIFVGRIGHGEVYRQAVMADEQTNDWNGELTEAEAMAIVEIGTPDHFRKRADEFFALDWTRPLAAMETNNQRSMCLHAADKATLAFQASAKGGRRWFRNIAQCFRDYVIVTRSKSARRKRP